MQIGMIGLGRMGANMARRLMRGGHTCVVYNHTPQEIDALAQEGATGSASLVELVHHLHAPRVVCLMIPAANVGSALDDLAPLLDPGDTIIDGGNSHYHDDIARAKRLAAGGLHFIDMGTSGGVWAAPRKSWCRGWMPRLRLRCSVRLSLETVRCCGRLTEPASVTRRGGT